MSVGRVTCPLLWAAALEAAQAYGVSLTTGGVAPARLPQPCGSSCKAPLLGRWRPPGLCAGTPIISCFHGSGRRLPWSPMRPGPALTSGLGGPLLPLAVCVGCVDCRVSSFSCPRCMSVCGVLANLVPVHRCACVVPFACAVVPCVPPPPPPNFLYFFFFCSVFVLFCFAFFCFFFKLGEGARAHCRHRNGQLLQRCNSVVFSGVRRQCFVGGRATGVRLARLDVHGFWSGWVWLVASLLLVLAG